MTRSERVDELYRELRTKRPDLLRACVQAAEAISLNHTQDCPVHGLGSDIEAAAVELVLQALRPPVSFPEGDDSELWDFCWGNAALDNPP